MKIAVVAHAAWPVNGALVRAWRAAGLHALLLSPDLAAALLRQGDVALFRLDVLPTLDGFEPGLVHAPYMRGEGVRILNAPWAILGVHDKLETARRLAAAGIPHPQSVHVLTPDEPVAIEPPFVVKPRFGSWGRDVFRCDSRPALRSRLRTIADRSWFRTHGALVQELRDAPRHDLRVLVAGGRPVGAAAREAAPGEWRTNTSLGGRLLPVRLDDEAVELALAAAEAVGGDLVGVDLLPRESGGYVVLELNGATDFDGRYSLPGGDVYAEIAEALGFAAGPGQPAPGDLAVRGSLDQAGNDGKPARCVGERPDARGVDTRDTGSRVIPWIATR
jgi:RimK family alpha-L-glutamate ligase